MIALHDGMPADLGHPVRTVDVELSRTSTRTVTLLSREPNNGRTPTVLRPPLVRPLRVAADAGRRG